MLCKMFFIFDSVFDDRFKTENEKNSIFTTEHFKKKPFIVKILFCKKSRNALIASKTLYPLLLRRLFDQAIAEPSSHRGYY